MAHWQLGHKEDARNWYDNAAAWMDKNQPNSAELDRFRAEAADMLGVNGPAPPTDQSKTEKNSNSNTSPTADDGPVKTPKAGP
jgi:hypothetical protein